MYQKTIMAMSTCNPTHPRYVWNWVDRWASRSQAYHSLAIRSWTSNPLACVFADQQTITWTSYIFASWWCIFDWRSFIAGWAFNNMLLTFSCDVYHSLKSMESNYAYYLQYCLGLHNVFSRLIVNKCELSRKNTLPDTLYT